MKKEALTQAIEQTHALMESVTCSKEAKAAAHRWLDALGTEHEVEETQRYIAELEADIVPIDTLISLAESEKGAHIFGEEKALAIAAHAKEIKAAGAKYCDCPACAAAIAILEKKADLL